MRSTLHLLVPAVMITAAPLATAAHAQWTDITSPSLQIGSNRGAAWGDYDRDGDQDLYVTKWGLPNQLFRNDGGGVFTDVTEAPLELFGGALFSGRAAWGDFDNDLDLDLYIVQSGDSHLLRNDGPLGFTDVTGNGPLRLNGLIARSAAWGDYDGDSFLDLYVGSNGGAGNASRLLHNNGDGSFSDVTFLSGPVADGGIGRGTAWADFDGDGDLDLYLANGSSTDGDLTNPSRIENRLFRNDGGTFVDITTGPLLAPTHSRGIAWGDYDNDGDLDLYVAAIFVKIGACCLPDDTCVETSSYQCTNTYGGTFLGNDTVCDVDTCPPVAAAGDSRASDADDLAGGSEFLTDPNGRNMLLRNDGGGVFTDVSTGLLGYDGHTRCCSWVDYDNDGDLDLFLVNISAFCMLLRNDGPAGFTNVAGPVIQGVIDSANSGAWADIEGDGDMDVFISYGSSANSILARNDLANGNHWLQVRLVGTISNRAAIGARLTLNAGGLTQVREISSGSGYFAQHQLDAHFGLGTRTVIDDLTVNWPSGQVTVITNPAPDQILTLIEPCTPGVDCADCDGDGTADVVAIVTGTSADCNWNAIPDECEPPLDCNGNGLADICEIADGTATDCNANGVLDECDIAAGLSDDCNLDGLPDECAYIFFPMLLSENTTGAADSTFLGPPDNLNSGLNGNHVTYDFLNFRVKDGAGPDLSVYEVDIGNPEFHNIDVLVSTDGASFLSVKSSEGPLVRIPGDEETSSDSYGRSYDLAAAGLSWARYVKIQSLPPPAGNGLDLDAIGAVNMELAACSDNPGNTPGDLNVDGVVNIEDLLAMLSLWGPCPAPPDPCIADLDLDGMVGITDLLILLGNWG